MPAADLWKDIYEKYWPYQWMPDNFTDNLEFYYGYSRTYTGLAELLIEFGEITCEKQDTWIQPRLDWLGALLAHFCAEVVLGHGQAAVGDPGPWGEPPENVLERRVEAVRLSYDTLGRRLTRLEAEIG